MKIAFVTTHLTVFGGGGKFLRDYANKFSERGHKIIVVAQYINQLNFTFNDKVLLIQVGGPLPSNPLYWINFKKIKKNYLKILNKLDLDIIISIHFPTNYICSSMNKKDLLKHIHFCLEPFRLFHDKKFFSGIPFLKRIPLWFIKIFFIKYDFIGTISADEVISISKFIRKKVKEIYGIKSQLHYIGVEIDNTLNKSQNFNLKQHLKLKSDTPIIFTLGLTHHMKGTKELLIIFCKVLKEIPEAVLLIGGWVDAQNKKIIKKFIMKLNIPKKNIFLLGFIKESFLKYYYKGSLLTIYTSIDEPYGLIPLESMKNSTPVIAFESGGPSETIINDKTGFLIKNNDFDDFAQKTIFLMKDKIYREKLSRKARKYIIKYFNIEDSISHLEIMFQDSIH